MTSNLSIAEPSRAEARRYGHENDGYATAELGELPRDMVRELDELNLNEILREKSEGSHTYDVFIVSLALRRLAQLEDSALSKLVIENLHQFTPVFQQTMNYFRRVTPEDKRGAVGSALLESVRLGASGHREYQQAWLLDLFATDPKWAKTSELHTMLQDTDNVFVRPKLIEVIGRRHEAHWFRQHRRDAQGLNSWELRSFIHGAMCMQHDEYGPWLKSFAPRLDRLGQTIAQYCKARPGMT